MTIQEAAAELGSNLLVMAQQSSEAILDRVGKNPTESSGQLPSRREVETDFLCFYAHLIDRAAFVKLGPERRAQLMDLMFPNLVQSLATVYFPDRPEAQIDYFAQMSRTMEELAVEYGHYSLNPREGAGLQGTLFWEFGKRVSRTFGNGDFLLAMPAALLARMMMKGLAIGKTLDKV